jgi:DNA-binding LacI/PurR family transcriptional regulator
MGDMRPTVKDVAKLAGVSPKTVSNVINGVVFVRPETRARVESALAELDYVPNMSARGLRPSPIVSSSCSRRPVRTSSTD